MNSIVLLFLISFPLFSVIGNSESAEKAEILCDCLKTAKQTKSKADKKTCQLIRKKHVSELGKDSPSYKSYISLLEECEKEIK